MTNFLVITGGSRGIGEKTISIFQQHGWQVINLSRTPCRLPEVNHIEIDLCATNWPDETTKALTQLLENADKICLVHNAAAFKKDNVKTLTREDMLSVLEINVIAPVVLNTLLIPKMKPGSSILYIGSTLSEMAVTNRASYVITKHALVGLMRSTCQDLAGMNISTSCICPGFVNTDMLTNGADMNSLHALVKEKVTAERLIEPQEIAELVYFCATHPVINGEVLHANLGQKTN